MGYLDDLHAKLTVTPRICHLPGGRDAQIQGIMVWTHIPAFLWVVEGGSEMGSWYSLPYILRSAGDTEYGFSGMVMREIRAESMALDLRGIYPPRVAREANQLWRRVARYSGRSAIPPHTIEWDAKQEGWITKIINPVSIHPDKDSKDRKTILSDLVSGLPWVIADQTNHAVGSAYAPPTSFRRIK